MKYVCNDCGKMLKVDRDIDDDRIFERAVHQHRMAECPGDFTLSEDAPWMVSGQPEPAT